MLKELIKTLGIFGYPIAIILAILCFFGVIQIFRGFAALLDADELKIGKRKWALIYSQLTFVVYIFAIFGFIKLFF